MIKKLTPLHALAVAAIAGSGQLWVAPAHSQQWEITANQEVKYFSWSGTRGYNPTTFAALPGSGTQIYAPFSLQVAGNPFDDFKLELVGRGGYVTSKQTTAGLTGSVSTFTDTVVSGTVTYMGIAGLQPYFSMNVNVPTGTTVLFGAAANARMDPDLVDIPTFGEGWNFGPTVGITFALAQNVVLSLGIGHTVRGAYDRENAFVPGTVFRLDPGDVTTIDATLGFRSGPLTMQLSASASREGNTAIDGTPFFRLGDRYFAMGYVNYAWTENMNTSFIASWNYYEKSEVLSPPPFLATEAFNSNSTVYRLRIEHAFVFGDWSFGPLGSWLNRDANAYAPTAYQFVPAKTRWSAGGNLKYKVNDKTLLYASAEHIWVEEDPRPAGAPVATPTLNYTAWMVSGGATFRY